MTVEPSPCKKAVDDFMKSTFLWQNLESTTIRDHVYRRLHLNMPVTICIATIAEADNYPKIVFSADRLLSGYVQFEHGNQKIFDLKKNCRLMLAGDPLKGGLIVSAVKKQIDTKEISITEIADVVSVECGKLRNKIAEQRILSPRGLTIKEFYSQIKLFPEWFSDSVDEELQEDPFQLSFLLFGVEKENPYLYEIKTNGEVNSYDSLGFAAIGIGAGQSIAELGRYQYGSNISLSQAIQLTYLAKKEAERVSGVGKETDLGILYTTNKGEVEEWRADKDFLKMLDNQILKMHGFELQLQKETESAIHDILYGEEGKKESEKHEPA